MTIIRESKRDDLLLPYLQLVRQHGIDLTLGQFKSYMLELLASKGGIHNLSLSSNYYLAGVTKYYFNGDLTLNKDLAVYKGDFSANDQWNEDVCNRLNALILILRNAYIDTVGEKFEIEEDFGTLSLPKLLRKYNKKINDELGIVNDTKKKGPEKEEKVYDHNVGNGYTYDILYSYNQGTKYERYTAPGSWCITYGEHHYNYYIKNLGGIHYVIFLKNGYQKIERKVGPGYTRRKPHDKYGNSMIALLQKNNSWEPTYITSRWNHGSSSDGTEGTEADHAYTLEEFVNITGVSVDDLKRIWQEWNENKTVAHRELDPRKAELREEKKQVLRKLKYAQMRFNGGELPDDTMGKAAKGLMRAAEDAEIRNVVFDLGTNPGGYSDAVAGVISLMTGRDYLCGFNELSKQSFRVYFDVDRNLDGEIDEKDDEVSYDFNYAVITSGASFSCGNMFPFLVKEEGGMVIGDRSGGGSCSIQKAVLSEGFEISISGCKFKLTDGSGSDLEKGVTPDVQLEIGKRTETNEITGEEIIFSDYAAFGDLDGICEAVSGWFADRQ